MSPDAATKLPGIHKTGDVTLKRGALTASNSQDVPLKKLPGKKKPPTLFPKGGKDQSTAPE